MPLLRICKKSIKCCFQKESKGIRGTAKRNIQKNIHCWEYAEYYRLLNSGGSCIQESIKCQEERKVIRNTCSQHQKSKGFRITRTIRNQQSFQYCTAMIKKECSPTRETCFSIWSHRRKRATLTNECEQYERFRLFTSTIAPEYPDTREESRIQSTARNWPTRRQLRETDCQPYQMPWNVLNWSARPHCRLFIDQMYNVNVVLNRPILHNANVGLPAWNRLAKFVKYVFNIVMGRKVLISSPVYLSLRSKLVTAPVNRLGILNFIHWLKTSTSRSTSPCKYTS